MIISWQGVFKSTLQLNGPASNFVVVFEVAAMQGNDETTTTVAMNHIILTFRLEPPNNNPFLILKPTIDEVLNDGGIGLSAVQVHMKQRLSLLQEWR